MPKKTEESVSELTEVPKDKVDSIKLETSKEKNLNTTIDKGKYKLSDVNDLVNKIENKSISRNETINTYNDIVKKVKKLQN